MTHVTVRYKDQCKLLEASPEWTVLFFKQVACQQFQIENFASTRMLFAGHLLDDNSKFKDHYLESHTQVHLVHATVENVEENGASHGSGRRAAREMRNRFFVYCYECGRPCRSKLRCRCKTCKSEAFLVTREPSCWADLVRETNGPSGKCRNQSLNCPGETPEFYFVCAEGGHRREAHDAQQSVVLQHIQHNFDLILCATCDSDCDIVVRYPCPADQVHVQCFDCFGEYSRVSLEQRRFRLISNLGYTLQCPGGCADSFIADPHHFLLLGREFYTRFKDFAATESVRQNSGVFCPNPACSEAWITDSGDRRVVCSSDSPSGVGCGLVFCRDCQGPYHPDDVPCAPQLNISSDHTEGGGTGVISTEAASRRRINEVCKRCPGCRVPTEKNDGCMHMTCVVCQCEWCWLCGIVWSQECRDDHWIG